MRKLQELERSLNTKLTRYNYVHFVIKIIKMINMTRKINKMYNKSSTKLRYLTYTSVVGILFSCSKVVKLVVTVFIDLQKVINVMFSYNLN